MPNTTTAKKNRNRPGNGAPATGADSKHVKALSDLQKGYSLERVEQWAREGKSVIWGGNSWEAPLIRACDTIPVGFAELWKDGSLKAE
jgi:hypothetical protein